MVPILCRQDNKPVAYDRKTGIDIYLTALSSYVYRR